MMIDVIFSLILQTSIRVTSNNKLIKIIEDPNVGEAFYMNCIEIAETNKDFNEEHDRP